ncbi:unnamed protein product [Clonostachys rosea f. rosea IK726]|uniref:Uncharacterized protein n=1 Tax=Clonostachys rosea f. rosea IK726 TaxID=1349383 RepID=A0ACA9TLI8_BIOOC|nr:unnamed protein product [Clonostachys rosea f. rosea IK726]
MRVAHELDVAHLQNHVQGQPLARILEHLHRSLLRVAQRRHEPLVREPRQRAHVVRIPLAVHAPLPAVLDVEHRLAHPLVLPLGRLALAVKVPHRLGEQLRDVRVLALQRVPDVVDADNVALAALGGAVDAQEPHDVAVVGVEELAGGGAVDAHLVDLGGVVADVLDVAQDVTEAVLREEVADVGAQPHVGDGVLARGPLLGREALEEDEALAVDEVLAEGAEDLAQLGEGEVFLRRWGAARDEGIGSVAQLLDFLVGEGVRPALWVVLGRAGDLLGEVCIRSEAVVQRGMLARRADSIGEDGARGFCPLDGGQSVVDGVGDQCSGSHDF